MPPVKHLPRWLPFHRRAAHGRQMIETHVTVPFEQVKADIVSHRHKGFDELR